jgi:hypothetical protein
MPPHLYELPKRRSTPFAAPGLIIENQHPVFPANSGVMPDQGTHVLRRPVGLEKRVCISHHARIRMRASVRTHKQTRQLGRNKMKNMKKIGR